MPHKVWFTSLRTIIAMKDAGADSFSFHNPLVWNATFSERAVRLTSTHRPSTSGETARINLVKRIVCGKCINILATSLSNWIPAEPTTCNWAMIAVPVVDQIGLVVQTLAVQACSSAQASADQSDCPEFSFHSFRGLMLLRCTRWVREIIRAVIRVSPQSFSGHSC